MGIRSGGTSQRAAAQRFMQQPFLMKRDRSATSPTQTLTKTSDKKGERPNELRRIYGPGISHLQHHLVQISFLRMHPFRPHGAHHLAETHHRHAAHSRRITALQNGENDRGRIEFELLSRLRQTKTTVEHLLLYGHGIELAVAQLQFRFLFGRKPITLAALQLRLQLGKQLLVLQWRAVYFLFHLGTKITATARGVGQQILMITGSYKRSHAGQVTVG